MPEYLEGVVIRKTSGFYYVQTGEGSTWECRLRGKLKDKVVLTGDRVKMVPLNGDQGIIEEVFPRLNELVRPAIANVQQVLVVMSYDAPAPNLKLLDRLLVLAEERELRAVVVLNKCDLEPHPVAAVIKEKYPAIGYPVCVTSAQKGLGLERLREEMKEKISVLAGPSGVGKSSLLNRLVPGAGLRTQEVSVKIGRGRHTTRHVELFTLPDGGWVADTPGFSHLDIQDIKKEKLARLFPEFSEALSECRFSNCLHVKEEECGVKARLQQGLIMESRYHSYLTFLAEITEKERYYR